MALLEEMHFLLSFYCITMKRINREGQAHNYILLLYVSLYIENSSHYLHINTPWRWHVPLIFTFKDESVQFSRNEYKWPLFIYNVINSFFLYFCAQQPTSPGMNNGLLLYTTCHSLITLGSTLFTSTVRLPYFYRELIFLITTHVRVTHEV